MAAVIFGHIEEAGAGIVDTNGGTLAAAFDIKVTILLRFCNKSTPQHRQMLVFTLP